MSTTFQSPSGDSLFSDATNQLAGSLPDELGFNPLAGIRCFLTNHGERAERHDIECFNPLAGIRCFLTYHRCRRSLPRFQRFNPLAGIRCFLTLKGFEKQYPRGHKVSIP